MPFENLSGDPDNAYFADGIQEEILTRLASIADLKVISRTSTQHYQSKPRNLAEIAKQLGVANILEGSVQKAADQVRVNVQLINAQTDSHLWAETYDRKLTDIFGVESEIAKGIAESLQAKLTGREEQALAVKPTNNPEAYDAYLRGLAFEARGHSTRRSLTESHRLFMSGRCSLTPILRSLGRDFLVGMRFFTSTPAAIPLPLAAMRLKVRWRTRRNSSRTRPKPCLPWVIINTGCCVITGLPKPRSGTSAKCYQAAARSHTALGLVARREGHWDESVAYFEQALALDPRNVELLGEAALTYAMLRQFPAALKLYDRALDIVPNDPDVMASKANIYQAEGNLEQAGKFLSQINAQTPSESALVIKMTQLRLERNYGEAIRFLQARQAQFHSASEHDKAITQVLLAFPQRLAGDTAGAKVTAEQARNTLEELCKNQPDNPDFARLLSLAYAALGEKDSALKEARTCNHAFAEL